MVWPEIPSAGSFLLIYTLIVTVKPGEKNSFFWGAGIACAGKPKPPKFGVQVEFGLHESWTQSLNERAALNPENNYTNEPSC